MLSNLNNDNSDWVLFSTENKLMLIKHLPF